VQDMIASSDIISMGDLNAKVGNDIILNIKERFNEEVANDRDMMLTELCAHNELRINIFSTQTPI